MASKSRMRFSLPIPVNLTTIAVLVLIVAVLYALSHNKRIAVPPPMNTQTGPDGQPGNPTGKQGIDYRSQAQEQYPYQEPGANTIPGSNSWV